MVIASPARWVAQLVGLHLLVACGGDPARNEPSNSTELELAPGAPGTPSLVSPAGSGVFPTPRYSWSSVTGAGRYAVWVNDVTGNRIQTTYDAAAAGCAAGGVCSVTPSTVLNPGPAKWWVQARNDAGPGLWSAALNFVVASGPPAPPVLTAPTGVVGTTTPTYAWQRSEGAAEYELWVDDSGGTRINQTYSGGEAGCASASACAVTPTTALLPGAAKFWVRARNSFGAGGWSAALSFQVPKPVGVPAAPSLIGPTGPAHDNTPPYSWAASPGAAEYFLWVNDATGTRVQQTYTAEAAGCTAGSVCSATPAVELSDGNARFWVQAKNSAGKSAWSAAMDFAVFAGPWVWLAYIADHTLDVDELWAVRVSNAGISAPVRVSAPLLPNQDVTGMRWTSDGKQLAYLIGGRELFVADMTGSSPAPPRRIATVSSEWQLAWSPDGRYVAYSEESTVAVTVVDLSQATPIARTLPLCSGAGGCPNVFPPETVKWSGDGGWLFIHDFDVAVFTVRVENGVPTEPRLIFAPGSNNLVEAVVPGPFGAQAVVYVHYGGTGNRADLRIATPTSIGDPFTNGAPFTSFLGWLANGEILYWDGAADYIGFTPIFDVSGWQVSFQVSADANKLALVVDDSNPSPAALYLRRRNPSQEHGEPDWLASELALADFSPTYAWAPDSRNLLYAKNSLFVVDTANTPLRAPVEFPGSIPPSASASSVAWGRSSNRILYTTTNVRDLKYIDFRDGTPRAPSALTPAYAHGAGDDMVWELAPNDRFVASKADFTRDNVAELYVTNVSLSVPGTPQRVHPAFAGAQDVAAFEWQPVLSPAP